MKQLEYVEFYITNVCNLNCPRCNRFNNYAFSGHMRWDDHANEYIAWSKILDIKRIGILGGEPMLHPEFLLWIQSVADLWPNADIMIISNGTQLHRHQGFYDLLQQYRGRIRLDISRHNAAARQQTLNDIENLYPHGFQKFELTDHEEYQRTGKHGYWTDARYHDQRYEIDPKKIGPEIWQDKSFQVVYRDSHATIRYSNADSFDESVMRWDSVSQRLYTLEELSDPVKAAKNCACKFSHHFLHGKLFKCGIVAVLPEFLQQFDVEMKPEHRTLLRSYQPAQHTWSDDQLDEFLQNLSSGSGISQCALCSETHHAEKFSAGTKKISIRKSRRT